MKLFFQTGFSGYNDADLRRFYPRDQILTLMRKKYIHDKIDNEGDLLIFDTARQHTWLWTSPQKLYCIIDNRKDDKPKVLWDIEKESLRVGPKRLNIEVEDFDSAYGIIKIGDKKVRKYSRSLFSAKELMREMENRLLE